VIFATVGSHPTFHFDRFLRALEAVSGEELVVQHGPGEPPQNASRAVPWMSFAEIVEEMERASRVVSHAGVGTILCAARAGHVPVVFPRLRGYGETVDDHQLELGRRLSGDGRVILVEDAPALPIALASAPQRGSQPDLGGDGLIAAVRAELTGAAG
jgi:UDP-N-acetylglucosamine transferase subunit ALG13